MVNNVREVCTQQTFMHVMMHTWQCSTVARLQLAKALSGFTQPVITYSPCVLQVMLWPEEMADVTLLVLSGQDNLVPSKQVQAQLKAMNSSCQVSIPS